MKFKMLCMLCIAVMFSGCMGSSGPAPFDPATLKSDPAGVAAAYVGVEKPDLLKGVKKVFIPSFQVEFITKSSASAHSYGLGNYQSADISVSYRLAGIDDSVFQALTDKAYTDFLADLKAAGVEVVPYAELEKTAAFRKIIPAGEPAPSKQKSRIEPKAGESIIFTPDHMPVYFPLYDPKAGVSQLFSQFGSAAKAQAPANMEGQLIDDLGAALMRVRIVVGFAEVSAKQGVNAVSATGKMRFSIAAGKTEVAVYTKADSWEGGFGTPKTKYYNVNTGKVARFSLTQPIISDDPFEKKITDTTGTASKVAEGALNVVSMLAGTGTRTTRNYEVVADPEVYRAMAGKYFNAMEQMLAIQMKNNF